MHKKIKRILIFSFSFIIAVISSIQVNAETPIETLNDIFSGGYQIFNATGQFDSFSPIHTPYVQDTYGRNEAYTAHNQMLNNELTNQYKSMVENITGEVVYVPVEHTGQETVNPTYVIQYVEVSYDDIRHYIYTATGTDEVTGTTRTPDEIGYRFINEDGYCITVDGIDHFWGTGFINGIKDSNDDFTLYRYGSTSGQTTEVENAIINDAKKQMMTDPWKKNSDGSYKEYYNRNVGIPYFTTYPKLELYKNSIPLVFPGSRIAVPELIEGTDTETKELLERAEQFVRTITTPSHRREARYVKDTSTGYVDADDNTLEARYRDLKEYIDIYTEVNSNARNDKIKTYRILQYRITDLQVDHVMNREGVNNYHWQIFNSAGNKIYDSYKISRNLKARFNDPGIYTIFTEQEQIETHSSYAQYTVDEFWILADTGQLLWKNSYTKQDANFNPDTSLTSSTFNRINIWIQGVLDRPNREHPWLDQGDPVKISSQTTRIK